MSDIPNPAAVPGIMPSEIAGGLDKDVPIEADPHFGTEASNETKKPKSDDGEPSRVAPEDR